ncbi:hypothetical protein [Clostridium manihotivorum]|uniref:Uncharacterized protein n=1 Tax=Clostridium manihotivorum TaxID=2320868 RepID=A0A3R5V9Y3_9CLOT|nr:hypothetical protein [Clostridium manihotivorum]QAA33504.1 hypothetical protein C1I91_18660 [Clostridium manihotivorum]
MKRKHDHRDLDYMKFIEIFNTEDRKSARDYVKEHIPFNYDYFIKLVKRYTGYQYNKESKKFELLKATESQFISIDDLLNKPKDNATSIVASIPKAIYYKDPLDELNLDLLQDRLIELSKYIKIKSSTKSIEINLIRLREGGYDIELIS